MKLDQWTKVRDANGEVAWVENKALGDRRTVLVTVPLADVRARPDAQSPLVFEAYKHVLLEVVEPPAGGWVRCAIATGSRASSASRTSGACEPVKIAILGAGAWGSALAISLAARHERDAVDARRRRAPGASRASAAARYLPKCALPAAVRVDADARRARSPAPSS